MSRDTDVQFGQIALQNKLISKREHDEAWKTLKKLKRAYKGKKKQPRLVDVLVQQEALSGSQARSVENARVYREARRKDKLYGRIALKSKFVKPKHIERALEKQKQAYLEGDDLVRLNKYLIGKKLVTKDQDKAILEVLEKLDVVDYMEGRKSKRKKESDLDLDDDGDDDDELEELDLDDDDDDDDVDLDDDDDDDDDDLEMDLDLDLDDDDGTTESIDGEEDLDALDDDIEEALSGIDEEDLDASSEAVDALDDSAPVPRGLSSDDLLDEDLDADEMSGLDLGDGLGKLDDDGDDDDDLGPDIALTSDEVTSAASGKRKKVEDDSDDDLDLGSDIDIDLGDLDDDDLDL